MCIGSIQSNASACSGACNGPSVETRACNPKDCPGIPIVYFCDFCDAKTHRLNSVILLSVITSLTH